MEIKNRLKIMIFLQYSIWGCWLTTLSSYMINTLFFTSYQVGYVYSTNGIASIIAPIFIGFISDKFIPANKLYVLCHLIVSITLIIAANVSNITGMILIMFLNSMAFMPTISLSNSISLYLLSLKKIDARSHFPGIRIYGTIGFMVSIWIISFFKLELKNTQIYISAIISFILSVYSLTLPNIPLYKNKSKKSILKKLYVYIIILFRNSKVSSFFIFAMLIGGILQVTNIFANPFLHDFAKIGKYNESIIVHYPSMFYSISQMSEITFILAIPILLKKFSMKNIMIISIFAWSVRFALFATGDPSPKGIIILILSMLIYGCAFDLFNISGSIFIHREVNHKMRSSAQGFFTTSVNGFGALFGSIIGGWIVNFLTTDGIRNWKLIWSIFSFYSFILTIIFAIIFHYKQK